MWPQVYGVPGDVADLSESHYRAGVSRDVLVRMHYRSGLPRAGRQSAWVTIGGDYQGDHTAAIARLDVRPRGRIIIPAVLRPASPKRQEIRQQRRADDTSDAEAESPTSQNPAELVGIRCRV